MIDFNMIPETLMHEFQGGKGVTKMRIWNEDGINKIMRITLEPGCSIGMHRHSTSSEIIYVISGTGSAILDGMPETVGAGQSHYCPKGSEHTFMNNGNEDLVFFAVVNLL